MLRIRLQRQGRRNSPHYRFVVTDIRHKRQGRYLENLGSYDPVLKDAEKLKVNVERMRHWVSQGAQPSDAVTHLLKQQGLSLKGPLTAGAPAPAAAPPKAAPPAAAPEVPPLPAAPAN